MAKCRQLAAILTMLWAIACSAGGQPAGGPPPAATGRTEALASAGAAPATAPTAPPDLGNIRFVFPLPAMTMLPMHIASVQGFDREEGFTATFVQAPGTTGVRALQAGEVDFSESAGASLAAAVQGAPIRIVVVHVAKSLFWLYARPELTLRHLVIGTAREYQKLGRPVAKAEFGEDLYALLGEEAMNGGGP